MAQAIFRQYDREALDREYNNRAKVADFDRYLRFYASESAHTRQALESRLNVGYGPSAAERLDIFPAGDSGAPVQVFIHGGYWKALSKDDFSFVANAFARCGGATVVIEYALIPSVDMDELVRQCRAALAWVWRNAASFGGDPGRIFVSGHSAGGHLTAMMVATDWRAFSAGLPADLVKGACGISGLYDLEPIRLCYLNDDLKLNKAMAGRNSPVLLARHAQGSLLLPVGALEGPEYLRQSHDLATAWQNRGAAPVVWEMQGEQHFSIVAQLHDPASELSRAVQRQMGLA
ncbi:MAG: alpha/beta hydrolase [Gammaproteobacteria bacterium]